MQNIYSLPIGSKIQYGTYKNEPLIWVVAHHNYPYTFPSDNVILMCTNSLSRSLASPSTDPSGKTQSYVYHSLANTWLNSGDTNWGGPVDCDYTSEPGFLSNANFSASEVAQFISFRADYRYFNNGVSSPYTPSMRAIPPCAVWLGATSLVENDGRVSAMTSEGVTLDLFKYNEISKATVAELFNESVCIRDACYTTSNNLNEALAGYFTPNYGFIAGVACPTEAGLYPCVCIPNTIQVSDTVNEDGYYTTEYYNLAPVISGPSSNLGDKSEPFYINYVINDENSSDTITVSEYIDDVLKNTYTATLGATNTFNITASALATLSLGAHTIKIEASDGKLSDVKTYSFVLVNSAPVISGTDTNLGTIKDAYSFQYTVTDENANDVVTVTEYLDSTVLKAYTAVLGATNTLSISKSTIEALSNGSHTIKVTASDGRATAIRTHTFTYQNTAPTISGQDGHLGDKILKVDYSYTINDADDDTVTVREFIDTTLIREYTAQLGVAMALSVSEQDFYNLEPGAHTLKIVANDGKLTTTRTLTFTAKIVQVIQSNTREDLGRLSHGFTISYNVKSNNGKDIVVVEKIDDNDVLRTFTSAVNMDNTLEVTQDKFNSLASGSHTLTISATDIVGGSVQKTFMFEKIGDDTLVFNWVEPISTQERVSKIKISPYFVMPTGATMVVEACNNGFDESPTWEDITEMVSDKKAFTLTNTEKTSAKWGLNIRFLVNKNSSADQCIFKKYAGRYE